MTAVLIIVQPSEKIVIEARLKRVPDPQKAMGFGKGAVAEGVQSCLGLFKPGHRTIFCGLSLAKAESCHNPANGI